MKLLALLSGFFAFGVSQFAMAIEQTPDNILVNCQFENLAPPSKGCHALVEIHIQSAADDLLMVHCPGLGTDTIVFNGEATFDTGVGININPAGAMTRPAVILDSHAFQCSSVPKEIDANLVLPEKEPYLGVMVPGTCHVVTAGCTAD
jgi:hypothetical protein